MWFDIIWVILLVLLLTCKEVLVEKTLTKRFENHAFVTEARASYLFKDVSLTQCLLRLRKSQWRHLSYSKGGQCKAYDHKTKGIVLPEDKSIYVTPVRTGAWELGAENVCFGANTGQETTFTVGKEGLLTAIRLDYVSGGVTCSTRITQLTNFGCVAYPNNIFVVISTDANVLLFPKAKRVDLNFEVDGYHGNSPSLEFYDNVNPAYVEKTTMLKLWYSEAFFGGFGSRDNSGTTCVNVYVQF